ncbi:MAG: hypothetical protein GY859_16805 [Desulfobacterales bacterium]|nr:hypothetical protein [Desulfobacterales bacterium]
MALDELWGRAYREMSRSMTRAASVIRSRAMRVLRGINSKTIFGFIF